MEEDLLTSKHFRPRFVFEIRPTLDSWEHRDMWQAGILAEFAHSSDRDAEALFTATAQRIAAMVTDDSQPLDVVETPLKVVFVVNVYCTVPASMTASPTCTRSRHVKASLRR